MARQLCALPLLIHSLLLGLARKPPLITFLHSLGHQRSRRSFAPLQLLVLSVYPAANITSVVVGRGVLCGADGAGELPRWELVLPAVKNIYRSLVRWGLEREIQVSAVVVSEGCLGFHDLIEALLSFLKLSGSFYLVNPETPHFLRSSSSEKKTHSQLVSAHRDALERFGFSEMLGDAWLVRDEKPIAIGRRLSSLFRSRGLACMRRRRDRRCRGEDIAGRSTGVSEKGYFRYFMDINGFHPRC